MSSGFIAEFLLAIHLGAVRNIEERSNLAHFIKALLRSNILPDSLCKKAKGYTLLNSQSEVILTVGGNYR